MAATVSRIILDAQGNLQMVVHPDKDSQLDDPAFAPSGTTQCDIPREAFSGVSTRRDLMAVAQPFVAMSGNDTLAKLVQARIDLIDAEAAGCAEKCALAELVSQIGDNPNAAQKVDIAKQTQRSDAAKACRDAIEAKIQALLGP